MITDLTEIKNYLKDKQICLLGNARSILNSPKDIDKYEIVCRMNRGNPKGRERYIGSKTDILFSSTRMSNNEFLRFNTKYVIWMVKALKRVPIYLEKSIILSPANDWQEMKDKYPEKKLPSTGCLAINFLLKHIEFKSLTIYGFDFFKSGTWYHCLKHQNWHPAEIEEQIIKEMLTNHKNVEVINE